LDELTGEIRESGWTKTDILDDVFAVFLVNTQYIHIVKTKVQCTHDVTYYVSHKNYKQPRKICTYW